MTSIVFYHSLFVPGERVLFLSFHASLSTGRVLYSEISSDEACPVYPSTV